MKERDIENYLRERVKAAGGTAYKFVSPGNNGVPDRIVMLPNIHDIYVELKAPGEKPTVLQLNQHRRLRALGRDVRVIDSKSQVDDLLQELTRS